MADIPKLTLAERLRRAGVEGGEAACPHLFRLFTDTYFSNLDYLVGGTSYRDTLEVVLHEYLDNYRKMPLLSQLVADSGKLPEMDESQLLYQVLIRPFAELEEEKERSEKACLSQPF